MTAGGKLEILLLEDDRGDAELIIQELRRGHVDAECHRVETEEDFLAWLGEHTPDIILADYALPAFDALQALEVRPESCRDAPFIVVTGSMSEEVAVACLKQGAADYVLKEQLGRLPLAIEAALDNARIRRERREVVAELAEAQRRYRRLFMEAQVGIYVSDRDGRLLECNPAFADIFGFGSPAEAVGTSVTALYEDPTLRPRALEILQREGQIRDLEHAARAVDGRRLRVRWSAVADRDEHGAVTRVAGHLVDVTEQREAEQRRDLLAAAIEASAEAVIITDPSGVIQYVNDAFEEITGYSEEEAVGRTPALLKSGEHDDAFYRELWTTIQSGDVFSGRFTNRRADGSLYHAETTISPVRDGLTGKIVNFVALQKDVTRELALQRQFEQSERLNSMGRLAGGVAHDFNNMLTVIQASVDLARDAVGADVPISEELDEIAHAAGRAADLTRQLLAFGRRQSLRPRVLALPSRLEKIERMLHRVLGEDVLLTLEHGAEVWPVRMDPHQLDHVLVNLAVNARHAMPEGGGLTIAAENVCLEDVVETGAGHRISPGDYVMLSVTDTGVGMDAETRDRAFEPFFTTKKESEGTGLGLSSVYGIVRQSGGYVRLYSEQGRGTTVRIYLPRASSEDEAGEDPGPEDSWTGSSGMGETILVVEDSAQVRHTTERALRRMGYRVLSAGDRDEALRVARGHDGPIHLVVSDVVLADIRGPEIVELLREDRPGMRALFTSGYAGADDRFCLPPGAPFIAKPFSADGLGRAVRAILEAET